LKRDAKIYWDIVTKAGEAGYAEPLWRAHCDAVNNSLVSRWLLSHHTENVLKTDLFDEVLADGLYHCLKSRARDVVGIDISPLAVKTAYARHRGLMGSVADARCLPFSDESFDLIVSISTLDHFEEPGHIIIGLNEFHRVLKSGGQLIITLDNPANPVIALRNSLPFRLLHAIGLVPYFVGATFSHGRLNHHLKQSGFDIIKTGSVMHCPRVFAVILARIIGRVGTPSIRKRFLRLLLAFEHLEKLPTRYLTGHFIAVFAEKRNNCSGR